MIKLVFLIFIIVVASEIVELGVGQNYTISIGSPKKIGMTIYSTNQKTFDLIITQDISNIKTDEYICTNVLQCSFLHEYNTFNDIFVIIKNVDITNGQYDYTYCSYNMIKIIVVTVVIITGILLISCITIIMFSRLCRFKTNVNKGYVKKEHMYGSMDVLTDVI